ncbi:MAG TPA: FAD-dependent oxidoreductase [Thermoanaerobaculia bacterium]
MSGQGESWTRRRFLEMVGKAGGTAAVYESMVALGLLRTPAAYAGPPKLPAGIGGGKSVVILGAGVGGLTAAYELQKAGYGVTVLEASARTGGRSLTVRKGDVIQQMGLRDQECRFDDGLYFNAGPGRIPYHHQAVLSYCRELGVALEVYVMESRVNLFQTPKAFEGEAVKNRRVANDTRGYIAELLAKAVRVKALDQELSAEDRQKLLSLLVVFGDVNPRSYRYEGSSRSGFRVEPGVIEPGTVVNPLELKSLLKSEFWKHRFYQPEDYEWQPTLFEPVGGMDKFARALASRIEEGRIVRNAEVTQVFNGRDGVRVVYRDRPTGRQSEVRADYCLSNIPLPLLRKLIANGTFAEDYKQAVGAVEFADTCKVAWQAERFWESETSQIYGGISWIDHPITQMWYPSGGFFTPKGILTGAYNYGDVAKAFGKKSLEDRREIALEGAERLHPGFAKHADVKLGMSIAWQLVPFQQGGWANWTWKDDQPAAYDRLLEPDERFQVCGDQVSYLPGWQEGAVLSAHHVIERIAGVRGIAPRLQAVGAAQRRSAARITGAEVE